jgi:ABC-type xylose transport system substrate-binding protein
MPIPTAVSWKCSIRRSAGKIKVVGERYTDGWAPENAQEEYGADPYQEQHKVDAVVTSNDSTAGGVVAAKGPEHGRYPSVRAGYDIAA